MRQLGNKSIERDAKALRVVLQQAGMGRGGSIHNTLKFEDANVAHGMTDWAATDVFGYMEKAAGSAGGLSIVGLRDPDSDAYIALSLAGFLGEAVDTTKSTAGYGIVHIAGAVKSGTTVTTAGANGNLVSIANAATTRAIFDAEGDLHLDATVQINAWDEYDDLALLGALRAAAVPALRERWGQFLEEARPVLEATGVATFNEDGSVWFGVRALQMLVVDALRQFAATTNARLERYEQELLRLGADPARLLTGED
jgi:hypothetical protein